MPYRNYNKSSKENFPWLAQVKVTKLDGRTIQRRHQCRTKKEALRWEAEERARIGREIEASELTRTVSLHEWATAYLDFAKERFVDSTYQEKCVAFRELFKHKKLDPYSMDVEAFKANDALVFLSAVSSGATGNVANKRRKNLRSAWQWGIQFLGMPKDNPFDAVQRFAEVRTPRRVPTMEEFWAVFEVAGNQQDRLMLFAYLHTGARRDELFRLRWKDVDFEEMRVSLSTRKNRAGEWESKWLPIGEELAAMLKQQQRVTGLLRFVFLDQADPDPQKWVPFQYRQHWMPRLCQRAGVEPFGIHGIRHLTASLLAQAGKPMVAIQEMLRHHSIMTTARYIHGLEKGNRGVLDALPGLDKSALKAPCSFTNQVKKTVND